MIKITVHDQLMNKVITFEKRRIAVWFVWFMGLVGILVIGTLTAFWFFGVEVMKRQTLELLLLFREDWEVVAEYLQDTVGVMFAELPDAQLYVGLSFIVLLVVVFWKTGKERHRVINRIKDLAMFRKKDHTKGKERK